jgi:hypothetical protein
MARKHPDLRVAPLPSVDSAPWADPGAVLELLYGRAEEYALSVCDWYLDDRRRKSLASRLLRAFAIVLATLGALVPLLHATIGWPDPSWGYVVLVLAGSAIGFDKLFGLSSAWMRDMQAAHKVSLLLTDLQHDWSAFRAGIGGRDHESALARLREFNRSVALVASSETDAWAREFDAAVADLGDLVRRQGK